VALLLFLDIDGCLRRNSAPKYELEAHLVENLERYVAEMECPKGVEKQEAVEIVITSTWKTAFSLDEIRSRFPPSLRLKIVGVTPSFPARDGSRYAEILAYLKGSGLELANWIAIDDDPLGFPEDLESLFLCDSDEGFQGIVRTVL
jgi:hypothetical protein